MQPMAFFPVLEMLVEVAEELLPKPAHIKM